MSCFDRWQGLPFACNVMLVAIVDSPSVTMTTMSFSEGVEKQPSKQEALRRQFSKLRKETHAAMKNEERARLTHNPQPTEDELFMGAFKEWLEPQLRDAVSVMYKKGYTTESSGFHGSKTEQQTVDGYFEIDKETKDRLNAMGVEVLRGPDIGLPKNTHITMLSFKGSEPSIAALKKQWDALVAVLPQKEWPAGLRPTCDRAEEFRAQFAPEHPSLEQARRDHHAYIKSMRY